MASILISNIDNTPKLYVAIADIGLSGEFSSDPFSDSNKLTYNLTRVSFGSSSTGTATPDRKGFLIRFNLKDKPNNWKKCEISLYVKKQKSLEAVSFSVLN